jgi:rhodanese-related sulfurtransferase
MVENISREELQAAIAAGEVTVVETLRTEHFEQGHLPGAIHIHFEAIEELAPELLPDRDAAIVTYCSNSACQNSDVAAAHLAKLGYSSVRRYVEGKEDWQHACLDLRTGS